MPLRIPQLAGGKHAGLYFIEFDRTKHGAKSLGWFKLGMSTDLASRLNGYHLCSPEGFTIHGLLKLKPDAVPKDKLERYRFVLGFENQFKTRMRAFWSKRAHDKTRRKETYSDRDRESDAIAACKAALDRIKEKFPSQVGEVFTEPIRTERKDFETDGLDGVELKAIRGSDAVDETFAQVLEEHETKAIEKAVKARPPSARPQRDKAKKEVKAAALVKAQEAFDLNRALSLSQSQSQEGTGKRSKKLLYQYM